MGRVKTPFWWIKEAVESLEPHMVAAVVKQDLTGDLIPVQEVSTTHHRLLSDSGWTENEFNNRTLRLVDAGWKHVPSPPIDNVVHLLFKRKQ